MCSRFLPGTDEYVKPSASSVGPSNEPVPTVVPSISDIFESSPPADFNALDAACLQHIARFLTEPDRDNLVSVSKSCRQAVEDARYSDLLADLNRPARCFKERMPTPFELYDRGCPSLFAINFRNVVTCMDRLNEPSQCLGPLRSFYLAAAAHFDKHDRDPLPELKRTQAQGHRGIWQGSLSGTTIPGNTFGRFTYDSGASLLGVWDQQKNLDGFALVEDEQMLAAAFFRAGTFEGYATIVTPDGRRQEGFCSNGQLYRPACPVTENC